jgi:fatty acid desaturase
VVGDRDDHSEVRRIDVWKFIAMKIVLFGLMAGLITAYHFQAPVWALAALALLVAHGMHGQVLMLHEAVHYKLARSRKINDFQGNSIGKFTFIPLSLYREIHRWHHTRQGTIDDEEFWPFVDTKQPRWFRCSAAFYELLFGVVWTPAVFMRAYLRCGSRITNPEVISEIRWEILGICLHWGIVLGLVHGLHLWGYFLVGYALPAWLAGVMQTMRRYVEHLGLVSIHPKMMTRSIIDSSLLGRVLSFSLLYEPFHGVHHRHQFLRHSALPYYGHELPMFGYPEMQPLLFESYARAWRETMGHLWDPKIGPQWRARAAGLKLV